MKQSLSILVRAAFTPALVVLAMALTGCRRDPVDRAMRALDAGNPTLAESLLADPAESDPGNPSIQMNLALARLKLGQIDSALAGFRRTADLVPDDPRPLEFMACVAASDGRWRMSQELLFEAAQRAPRSPRVQTALANAELKLLGAHAASNRLSQILLIAPKYSPAIFNLALIQYEYLNNPAEAALLFDRYLAVSTDAAHLEFARSALAELKTAAPKVPPASAASQPPPPQPQAHPQNAAQAYNEGVRLHTAGKLDQAFEAYTRALAANPSMANARYNIGLIHRSRKDLAAATQSFKQALELQPALNDARYMLAVTFRDQGQTGNAIDQLETLVARNPAHAQAHHALGMLYKDTPATLNQARREFETYIRLNPDGPLAEVARNWLKYHN